MPQNAKIRILDQLWRLVKPGEFVALQDGNFLTLSVCGESRTDALHGADLLYAAIKSLHSPARVNQCRISIDDRLVKVRAIVDLG